MLQREGAAVILIGLAAALAQADEPWKEYANKNGVTFEKRQASDSKFYEYRATTLVQAPVQAILPCSLVRW